MPYNLPQNTLSGNLLQYNFQTLTNEIVLCLNSYMFNANLLSSIHFDLAIMKQTEERKPIETTINHYK